MSDSRSESNHLDPLVHLHWCKSNAGTEHQKNGGRGHYWGGGGAKYCQDMMFVMVNV